MADQVTVEYLGKRVKGRDVDVKTSTEHWNEYVLEDGTKLRLKTVVQQVIRLEERKPDGEPIYLIRSMNIVDARVPEDLKVKGSN